MKLHPIRSGWALRWLRQSIDLVRQAPAMFVALALLCLATDLFRNTAPPVFLYLMGVWAIRLAVAFWTQTDRGVRNPAVGFFAMAMQTDWRAIARAHWIEDVVVLGSLLLFSALILGLTLLIPASSGPHSGLSATTDHALVVLPSFASSVFTAAILEGWIFAFMSSSFSALAPARMAADPKTAEMTIPSRLQCILNRRNSAAIKAGILVFAVLCAATLSLVSLFFVLSGLAATLVFSAGLGLLQATAVVYLFEGVRELFDLDPPRAPKKERAHAQIDARHMAGSTGAA